MADYSLTSKQCRYCKSDEDSQGGIYHKPGCDGLKDVRMNRLQYDALVDRASPEPPACICRTTLRVDCPVHGGASQPPTAARFKVGDDVEFTNRLQQTFAGIVKIVDSEPRYAIAIGDEKDRNYVCKDESELRALTKEAPRVTEEECCHCQGAGKLGTPQSDCPFCSGEGVRRRDADETDAAHVAETKRTVFRGDDSEPCLNCGKKYADHITVDQFGTYDVCPHGPL